MTDPSSKAAKPDSQQVTLETSRLVLRAAQPSDAIPLHEAFKDPEVMRYWSTTPHTTLEPTKKWINSMITSSQNGITDFIITLKQPLPTASSSTADTNDSVSDTSTPPLPIGKIGIYRPPPSNEIGFMIARSYWGQGLAKEAKTCMLDYLFSLERVEDALQSQSQSQIEPRTQPTPTSNLSDVSDLAASNSTGKIDPQSYTTLSSSDQLSPWRYPCISADVDPRNKACKALLSRMGFTEIGFVERTDCIGGEWVDSVFYELDRSRWIDAMSRS